ncbi:hypothetical protein [uncultured Rheinheimera sp.]|uniref:hypothetical protein n=1 Tax=uncultured Rheinheimera sp. TaxID=400532 RepID=UPI002593C4F3|nr:hypothetical protein [uncultured Rheinheimera sp.]
MLDKQLGNDFHLLEWKEIENYIPFDILIKVAEKRWDTFNQKAGCSIERFSDISEDEFKSEISGVGMILERYVDKTDDLPRKFFEDNSGTIKDKVKFCQTAISIMSQSDDWRLTPELNILCNKIWEHIIQNN